MAKKSGITFDFDTSDLEKKLQKLGGEVTLDDLFSKGFMGSHTSFSSLDEMVQEGGFSYKTSDEAASLLESEEWSTFVANNTKFALWQEMLASAGAEHMKKQWES